MLGVEELLELEEALKPELADKLTYILTNLNRAEKLEDFLSLLGLESLLENSNDYGRYKTGKILVFGQSEVKADVLASVGSKLGISKDRFEFHLEYDDAKSFNFRKIQYNPTYSVILFGPTPHSGVDKGDNSSIITAVEKPGSGYPPVTRLGHGCLKISKSDFHLKLSELIQKGVIKTSC